MPAVGGVIEAPDSKMNTLELLTVTALVMEPKILLFDEPDSGLDPVRTTLLCDLIREINDKYHATSVVVSHDVGAVRRFADNIGILYKGKMRHFGNKKEIEESDDEFVHQFFNAPSSSYCAPSSSNPWLISCPMTTPIAP